jgi:hypothetical protein
MEEPLTDTDSESELNTDSSDDYYYYDNYQSLLKIVIHYDSKFKDCDICFETSRCITCSRGHSTCFICLDKTAHRFSKNYICEFCRLPY